MSLKIVSTHRLVDSAHIATAPGDTSSSADPTAVIMRLLYYLFVQASFTSAPTHCYSTPTFTSLSMRTSPTSLGSFYSVRSTFLVLYFHSTVHAIIDALSAVFMLICVGVDLLWMSRFGVVVGTSL